MPVVGTLVLDDIADEAAAARPRPARPGTPVVVRATTAAAVPRGPGAPGGRIRARPGGCSQELLALDLTAS